MGEEQLLDIIGARLDSAKKGPEGQLIRGASGTVLVQLDMVLKSAR
jgi:hypothetical protein